MGDDAATAGAGRCFVARRAAVENTSENERHNCNKTATKQRQKVAPGAGRELDAGDVMRDIVAEDLIHAEVLRQTVRENSEKMVRKNSEKT